MSHQQHLLRAVIFYMLFEQYQLLIRSSFDPIFFFKTTIQSVEDKVNPVNLTNPIVYSMQYKDIYILIVSLTMEINIFTAQSGR